MIDVVVPLPPGPDPTPDPAVIDRAVDPAAVLLEVLVSGPTTWATLAGLALPLVTGLITGRAWHPATKGLMLAGLSFAAAVAAELAAAGAAGPLDWRAIMVGAFLAWITAQVAHAGVWRHTVLSQRLQDFTLAREPETAAAPAATAQEVDLGEHSVAATIARATARPTPPRPTRAGGAVHPAGLPPRPPPGRRHLDRDNEPSTLPER